jgi:hypothetical protein
MMRHFRDHHAAALGPGLPRKLRQFALNGYQRLWRLVCEQCDPSLAGQVEQWIVLQEQCLDRLLTDAELRQEQVIAQDLARANASAEIWEGSNEVSRTSRGWLTFGFTELASERDPPWAKVFGILDIGYTASTSGAEPEETYLAERCQVVREMFGNPFRPITIDPLWLAANNGTVPKLAQAIYDEHAFDRLPILADALEDVGCTNLDMFIHCRSGGEHVRGCWVVDLLLPKG